MSLRPEEFKHSMRNIEFMTQDFKEKVFKSVAKKSVPLFLRGQDTINITPSVSGHHEVDVEEVLCWAARTGHNDFLIDIGANIGLISCLCGNHFKQVFCYEPNPLAFKILEVNTKIALSPACTVHLFNFAIGREDSSADLVIPKYNWGGAFIVSGNSYDEKTLLKKDGYATYDPDNYLHETVTVCKAADSLGPVFESLAQRDQKRGVIKIDAEGYEMQILQAIACVLPVDFEVLVVFENHLQRQLKAEVLGMFAVISRLYEIKYRKVRGATIVRLLKSLCGARRSVVLADTGDVLAKGNFALLVGGMRTPA